MYTSLDTILMLLILIIFFIVMALIFAMKKGYVWRDFINFNKNSKEVFGKSYLQVCKEKNLLGEVKETKRLMLQAMWVKKWKILIPLGLAFLLLAYLIDMNMVLQYYYFALVGFLFSIIGLFYGLLDYLKTPEKLVLQNTTLWGKNNEALKIEIESQLDYMVSWTFIVLGVVLNFLSFMLGILIQIISSYKI